MERCPVCGFELPEGPNKTCYNCLGREKEARRYGSRRPLSPLKEKKLYRQGSGPMRGSTIDARLARVKPAGGNELTPAGERTLRQGINHLLEDIYHEQRYLSQMLRDGGASAEEISRLRKNCLAPFLARLIPAWRNLWAKTIGKGAGELVCRWYGLDGQPPAGAAALAKEFGLPEGEVRLAIERALQTLRFSSKKQELERVTVEVGRAVLAEDCDP